MVKKVHEILPNYQDRATFDELYLHGPKHLDERTLWSRVWVRYMTKNPWQLGHLILNLWMVCAYGIFFQIWIYLSHRLFFTTEPSARNNSEPVGHHRIHIHPEITWVYMTQRFHFFHQTNAFLIGGNMQQHMSSISAREVPLYTGQMKHQMHTWWTRSHRKSCRR